MVRDNAPRGIIAGNVIEDRDSHALRVGFGEDGVNWWTVISQNHISNIEGSGQRGILIDGPNACSIVGNTVENVTNDEFEDLGNADFNLYVGNVTDGSIDSAENSVEGTNLENIS